MRVLATILLVLLAFGMTGQPAVVSRAHAEPGDSCDRNSDCDAGERCRQGECVLRTPGGTSRPKGGETLDGGGGGRLHCCDMAGRKWCLIVAGPQQEGAPCFCSGVPGSGFMCR